MGIADHLQCTPFAPLIRDSAGNLYGTAQEAGTFGGACGTIGCGIVFKMNPAGKEKILYSFAGGTDGANPQAGLVRDAAGNLYGTTTYGGGGACQNGSFMGCGTVFKVDTTGKETILYSFTGGTDGANPFSGLVRDNAGNLYGTTYQGGNTGCQSQMGGCGTVFKVDATGTETILYRFTGGTDGESPFSGLLLDAAGNLYGTAAGGGVVNMKVCESSGCGVVFKIIP